MKSQLKRYLSNKSIVIGGVIVLILLFVAIFAPLLTPYDPYVMDMSVRLHAPDSVNLLGTDQFGRDLLSRLIYGARVSLIVGVIAVVLSCGIGIILGLLAGYYGGWVDRIINQIMDIFLSFPAIILAIALAAVLGSGVKNVIIVIGLTFWMRYARVVRAEVFSLREQEHILSAITIGIPTRRILFKYILPNTMAPLIVMATLGLGSAIITEATLSFLGLGVKAPMCSWGEMLSYGLDFMRRAPYMSIIPGIAIMITVMGFNIFGNGIRDVTDPTLSRCD